MTDGRDRERARNEDGSYVTEYPLERFEDALRALGGEATSTEVEEEVGCKYRTVHAKLSDLEYEGRVTSRKVGNAKLWRLVEADE